MQFSKRYQSHSRVVVLATASAALIAAQLSGSAPASAASLFKAPFPCGQSWTTSTYGGHGGNGNARDFNLYPGQSDLGRPTLASASGTVSYVSYYRGRGDAAGNMIVVDHRNGWKTEYLHLASINVSTGARVTIGQRIGTVGDTGGYYASQGRWVRVAPHLHYVQRYRGTAQPAAFDGRVAPVGYGYGYSDPKHTSTNCGGTVSVASRRNPTANKVKIKALGNTAIRANIGPNRKNQDYTAHVQKLVKKTWKTRKTVRTHTRWDNVTIKVRPGTWRVYVPAQNGRTEAMSNTITLLAANKVKIKALGNTAIRANIGPNRKNQDYTATVQELTNNVWRNRKTVRTNTPQDNITIPMPPGTYRVYVPAQNGRTQAMSNTLTLPAAKG